MNATSYIPTEFFRSPTDGFVDQLDSEIEMLGKGKRGDYYTPAVPEHASSDVEMSIIVLRDYREQRNTEPTAVPETTEQRSESSIRSSLREQLAELQTAVDNWDGYGAEAAKKSALKHANYVVDKWDAPASLGTEVALLSDGCVSFEFYDSEDDLLGAFDILDDGSAAFALSINSTADSCGEFSLDDPSKLTVFFETLKMANSTREQKISD